jgi:signal peptidase I, bacterial type
VAVAGDQVVVNPRGEVSVNGKAVPEPYVSNYCPVDAQGMSRCRTLNVTVPKGHVLALGDNRSNSWDGRYWPGGPFLPDTRCSAALSSVLTLTHCISSVVRRSITDTVPTT